MEIAAPETEPANPPTSVPPAKDIFPSKKELLILVLPLRYPTTPPRTRLFVPEAVLLIIVPETYEFVIELSFCAPTKPPAYPALVPVVISIVPLTKQLLIAPSETPANPPIL